MSAEFDVKATSPADERATRPLWRVALVLLISLPPLLIGIGRQGPNERTMEVIQFDASVESWRLFHAGDRSVLVIPRSGGEARIQKPPLLVWASLLAWTGLDPETADIRTLAFRARLPSVFAGVIVLLATMRIGSLWRGREIGFVAALALGGMTLFQTEARLASYDIHLAAWSTLAIAISLAALRPIESSAAARRTIVRLAIIGVLSGLALALAWLAKGPLALVVYVVPMCGAIVGSRAARRRLPVVGGVALLTSLAIVAPWYVAVMRLTANAEEALRTEYSANLSTDHSLLFYPVRLIAGSMPWSPWWILGLLAPLALTFTRRLNRLFPIIWLLALLITYSAVAGKASRYLAPILPAAALLAAIAWREARQWTPGRWLGVAHFVALIGISFVIGPAFAMDQPLAGRRFPAILDFRPVPMIIAILASATLVALAICGLIMWRRNRWLAAAILTASWTSVATTILWLSASLAPTPLRTGAALDPFKDIGTRMCNDVNGYTFRCRC